MNDYLTLIETTPNIETAVMITGITGSALVLKINACGEKEWCKKYSPNASGVDIAFTPDGGYMALIVVKDSLGSGKFIITK